VQATAAEDRLLARKASAWRGARNLLAQLMRLFSCSALLVASPSTVHGQRGADSIAFPPRRVAVTCHPGWRRSLTACGIGEGRGSPQRRRRCTLSEQPTPAQAHRSTVRWTTRRSAPRYSIKSAGHTGKSRQTISAPARESPRLSTLRALWNVISGSTSIRLGKASFSLHRQIMPRNRQLKINCRSACRQHRYVDSLLPCIVATRSKA
jgi:hypothetical protein